MSQFLRSHARQIVNFLFSKPVSSPQHDQIALSSRISLDQLALARSFHLEDTLRNMDPALEGGLTPQLVEFAGKEREGQASSLPKSQPLPLVVERDIQQSSGPPSSSRSLPSVIAKLPRKRKCDTEEEEGGMNKKRRVYDPTKPHQPETKDFAFRLTYTERRPLGAFMDREDSASEAEQISKKVLRDRQRGAAGRRSKHSHYKVHHAQEGFDNHYEDTRITIPGWSGFDVSMQLRTKLIQELESDGKVEQPFYAVSYNGTNTAITNSNGLVILYRTVITSWILGVLPHIAREAKQFMEDTSTSDPAANKSRGSHWYCIAGVDRNSRQAPHLSKWHEDHRETIARYFAPGSLFSRLMGYGCTVLKDHFPVIARRYQESMEFMEREYSFKPQFGLFYNWCLNGVTSTVKRVHCLPHVDFKNIALGVCMIFIYGHFNHREKCWLVIWEAGVVIELPPGVFLLYPSSLFLHFNVDISKINFVTTKDGSKPTTQNSNPLFCPCGAKSANNVGRHGEVHGEEWLQAHGRGSMVWFNQAMMFQTSKLASVTGFTTVKMADAAGAPTHCNVEYWHAKGVFPSVPDSSL